MNKTKQESIMNNQVINQEIDQAEYYTKEETLYLIFLSEVTSQRDHLKGERKRAKDDILKGESPSWPDQFRNHFEDTIFGYYRDENGDFEDAEGDSFSPIEGLDDLEKHNPDIANKLLIEFLGQQISDYDWVAKYNQELFNEKDFRNLYRIFGWRALESDIPLLPKSKIDEASDFYYEIRESDKGNWIRCDIEEFMTEVEYDLSEDQLIALDNVWCGKVGDEFVEKEIDPNELNYQRKDLIENNLE
jgi:hypothetical protein